MFSVASDIEITNISEIRTMISEIIKKVGEKKRIIVTKNNEPSMVIMNFEEYQNLIYLIEQFEDEYFGKIGIERLNTFDKEKGYSLKDVEGLVGL